MKTKNRIYKRYTVGLLLGLLSFNILLSCAHREQGLNIYNNQRITYRKLDNLSNSDPELNRLLEKQSFDEQLLDAKQLGERQLLQHDSGSCIPIDCFQCRQDHHYLKRKKSHSSECPLCVYEAAQEAKNHEAKLCKKIYCFICKEAHERTPRECDSKTCYFCAKRRHHAKARAVLVPQAVLAVGISVLNPFLALPIVAIMPASALCIDKDCLNKSHHVQNPMIIDGHIRLRLDVTNLSIRSINKFIIRGLNINARTPDEGDTLAILAAKAGRLDSLRFIKNHGGDLHQVNKDGLSALDYASKHDHLKEFVIENQTPSSSREATLELIA